MAAIRPEEMFDFEGFFRNFQKVEAQNERIAGKFVESAANMKSAWKTAISEVVGDLGRLETLLKSTNMKVSAGGGGGSLRQEINDNISSLERYKKALAAVEDASTLNTKTVAELKAGISALKTQYDNLDPTAADFAVNQQKIAQNLKSATEAMNTQNQAMKAAVRAVGEANNSYNQLNRKTTELKTQLRNMPDAFNLTTGAINKHNVAAVAMQRQIDINDKALKRMDASMGNYQRNVGNYQSVLKGINFSLTSMIAPVLGVASAYEALHASIKVIDQMSRLKLSLEAVSTSSDQVAKRWEFLSTLADRTGQDISSLASNYVNFAGATRNTSLEGSKGDAIFKSFSNTFAALGKSSDVANRGLYALQQMISKGKVSSEELNQQLAEALPGANKLFADAVGVSTMKLADMMKHGEVLATDVLPKVAKRLEELYGDRAQKNIETISGSWTRVVTQFKLFLDMLNGDNAVSKFFAGLNNGIADTFKGLRALITDFSAVETRVQTIRSGRGAFENNWKAGAIGTAQDYLDASRQIGKENQWINEGVGALQGQNDNARRINLIMKEEGELRKLKKEYEVHIQQGKDIIVFTDARKQKTASLVAEMEKQERLIRKLKESEQARIMAVPEKNIVDPTMPPEEPKKQKTQYEKLIEQANKKRGVLVDDLLADAKAGRELAVSDKALESWNKLYSLIEKVATATGDQIPSNLRELNDKLNKNPTDIADQIPIIAMDSPEKEKKGPNADPVIDLTKWNALLGVHEKELANMAQRLMTGSLKKFSDEYATQLTNQLKIIQDLEKQASIEQNETERAAIQERIQLAKQEFDEKMRLAQEEVRAKKELQDQLIELAQVSVDAVFQIGSDQRSADMEANRAQMEHQLSLTKGNEVAQERIKKEYAKKDLELRQKQAKADKAQAAFSIGINTAKGIINALATSGPPWIGIAMAAIIGAMGAIQLAAVLAKPIPQFAVGTQNAPAGPAEVAERGPELHESNGRMYLHEKRTVVNLKRGDKIYTAAQTEAMLKRGRRSGQMIEIASRGEAHSAVMNQVAFASQRSLEIMASKEFDYNKIRDAVIDGLKGLPVNHFNMDERGFSKHLETKNGTTRYLNDRFSLT